MFVCHVIETIQNSISSYARAPFYLNLLKYRLRSIGCARARKGCTFTTRSLPFFAIFSNDPSSGWRAQVWLWEYVQFGLRERSRFLKYSLSAPGQALHCCSVSVWLWAYKRISASDVQKSKLMVGFFSTLIYLIFFGGTRGREDVTRLQKSTPMLTRSHSRQSSVARKWTRVTDWVTFL